MKNDIHVTAKSMNQALAVKSYYPVKVHFLCADFLCKMFVSVNRVVSTDLFIKGI